MAAVVGVAAIVTGVALGVGSGADAGEGAQPLDTPGSGTAGGPPVVASSGRSSDVVQARANRLYERFADTPAQRNAVGVLQAWDLNGAMDQCMEREGFPGWDWSAQRNTASRTDALATSTFFADPAGRSYSRATMDRAAEAAADETGMLEAPEGAEDDAVTACMDSTPDASAGQHAPRAARRLAREWWGLLVELDQQFGDQEAFAACFAKAGVSVGSNSDSLADAQIELSYLVPSAAAIPSSPGDTKAGGEAWQAFLEAEQEVDDASWDCRSDVYRSHIDDVDAALEAFETANRRPIAAA